MTELAQTDNAATAKPWPGGKRIAVVFNVCLEAWSDGKAPGISPMGDPLPAGVLDTMAISWAAHGVRRGIYRLLDAFARHRAAASVMVSYEKIVQAAAGDPAVWIATRAEIARHILARQAA